MTTPQTKRVCITGTAESWRKTPWADPTIEVWSLNDAWCLGLPRANRWFELHPMDRMYFRKDRVVKADDIPPGHYVRPAGHLAWLQQQAAVIPVYTKEQPPEGWPVNAQQFPWQRVFDAFGEKYWASGPSYMLALAVLEGYREIWITGIHLATANEYREQRPQWENLIGRILGPHVTETARDGFRFYQGSYDGEPMSIVLPDECPILHHPWRYAYDDRPQKTPDPMAEEWAAVQQEKAALVTALVNWPKGKDKRPQLDRLQRLEIVELDIEQQRHKRAIVAQIGK